MNGGVMWMRNRLRASGYLLVTLVTGLAVPPAVAVLVASAATVAAAGIGLVLCPLALYGVRLWGQAERWRSGLLLGEATARARLHAPWLLPRLRAVVLGRPTWRAVAWLPIQATIGTAVGLVGLVAVAGIVTAPAPVTMWLVGLRGFNHGPYIGDLTTALVVAGGQLVAAVAVLWWVVPPLARGYARLAAIVLSPSDAERRAAALAQRVDSLTETRAEVIDAHGAELRRIERDMHDGPQARLVSIAMRLGLAERKVDDDPAAVAGLIRDARKGAEEAIEELRDVIRTMYPPILADRGLAGALAALGTRCPVPVEVQAEQVGQVPPAVEAAAYFVVTEALANVARHSGATRAWVRVRRAPDRLLVEVTDDGHGGADESRGTGIAGMRRRVAALDGIAQVDSPAGGPTRVAVELPCGP